MHTPTRSCLALLAVFLFAAAPGSAFEFPLSDSASRAAYFLGQRRDLSMGEFLARYSKHLPAPKSGPYVSDVLFLTPFAQLVQYSSRQGIYSAQQAELDGRTKITTVEVTVYIYFTETYGAYIVEAANSRSSTPGVRLRSPDFWRDFTYKVLGGDELLEPAELYGEPQYRCVDEGGCLLIGAEIHLSVPAELFTSDSAFVEVSTPDDQLVTAEFNLASLR
jgi:hypothetical protein